MLICNKCVNFDCVYIEWVYINLRLISNLEWLSWEFKYIYIYVNMCGVFINGLYFFGININLYFIIVDWI